MKRILMLMFVFLMIATLSMQDKASAAPDKDRLPEIMKMSNFTILK